MVQYQVQVKPIESDSNKCIGKDNVDSLDTSVNICKNPPSLVGAWKRIEQKLDMDVWTTFATAESVKQAMIIAKPLIEEYGVDNVQICKVVPTSTEIIFESKA